MSDLQTECEEGDGYHGVRPANVFVWPTPTLPTLNVRTCADAPQCGGLDCNKSGRPTYSNKDCCINGVLNNKPDCSVSNAAPCIITEDGKLIVPP